MFTLLYKTAVRLSALVYKILSTSHHTSLQTRYADLEHLAVWGKEGSLWVFRVPHLVVLGKDHN